MIEDLQRLRSEDQPTSSGSQGQKLWFVRLSSRLNLPFWAGVWLVALVPAIVLWALGTENGITVAYAGTPPIVSLLLLALNMVFLLSASQLICTRILQLRDHANALRLEHRVGKVRGIYSLSGILIVWFFLLLSSSGFFDTYVFNLHYSFYKILLRIISTSYLRFAQATFLWVLGCATYCIYSWGKLPMKLKSFAEDKTLGLNPFGNASLLCVAFYIAAVLLTFPVFVDTGEEVVIGQTIFFLLGLLLFLGPLLSLRKKLVEIKSQKMAWISTRHARVMQMIEAKAETEGSLDQGLVNELIAIDHIKRDIQAIRHWPFDFDVITRLATVVIVPVLTVLIATIISHAIHI